MVLVVSMGDIPVAKCRYSYPTYVSKLIALRGLLETARLSCYKFYTSPCNSSMHAFRTHTHTARQGRCGSTFVWHFMDIFDCANQWRIAIQGA